MHARNGLFAGDGGYELVLGLAAGLLVIGVLGAGRFSIDDTLVRSTDTAPVPTTEARTTVWGHHPRSTQRER